MKTISTDCAQRDRGFTIIELLVVIVVIAILSTVTVVAYAGVRQRADDSQVIGAVHAIVAAVNAYAAINSDQVPQADWACMGEPSDFPAEKGYTAEWCYQPYQDPQTLALGADHPIQASTNAKFRTIVSRTPNSRIPEVDLGGGIKYRGILYDSRANQNAQRAMLQFYINGSRSSCPIGSLTYSTSTYSQCEYYFTYTSETGT